MLRVLLICFLALPACALLAQSAGSEVPTTYRRGNVLSIDSPPTEARTPEVAVSYANRGTVPVPGPESLDMNRPSSEYPAILAPQDFFGRTKRPSTAFADPFNSSLLVDGNPSAPGDKPTLPERSKSIEIQPWSMQTISVAEEVWVTMILMRDGEMVYPRSQLVGSDKIIEVQRSAVKESPYLYLRARDGCTDLSGNYLRTTLDIEVIDKAQRVFVYKFDVQVVPINHPNYSPTLKVNMVKTELPPVYGREGSRYAEEKAAANTPLASRAGGLTRDQSTLFQPGSAAVADGRKFTRADVRTLLPIMIGMAKAYDEAVAANAQGYGPRDIRPFQPCTVAPDPTGRPSLIKGKVPAFRNPYDGQTYFVLRSYFFPRYDAILYDVSFKNTSSETLWWNYSDLQIVPGFEPSNRGEQPTVVSPEMGETTPPGKINTLWVLVQGRGWEDTSTPIRLRFPPMGMEAKRPTLVHPHVESPPSAGQQSGISIFRQDTIDLLPGGK